MIALKCQNWRTSGGGGDPEEEMYKELIQGLANNTATEMDLDFPIDATLGKASGVRLIYGQTHLKKVRLRDFKTDNYSTYYLNAGNNVIEEIWLDNTEWISNSLFNSTANLRYVFAPKANRIQNAINGAPAPNAVWDFGGSRTCQQLLDSWSTLFAGVTPHTNWHFLCSDGTVAWNGSAWAKV